MQRERRRPPQPDHRPHLVVDVRVEGLPVAAVQLLRIVIRGLLRAHVVDRPGGVNGDGCVRMRRRGRARAECCVASMLLVRLDRHGCMLHAAHAACCYQGRRHAGGCTGCMVDAPAVCCCCTLMRACCCCVAADATARGAFKGLPCCCPQLLLTYIASCTARH